MSGRISHTVKPRKVEHRVGRQSKMLILSTNVDQKSLETEFLIAICRPTGDKWQSKTPFLAILIRVRRLLRAFSIAAYPLCLSKLTI